MSRSITDEAVLAGGARLAFGLLSIAVFTALGVFATLWLTLPGRLEHPAAYVVITAVLAYLLALWVARWVAFERMRRPVHLAPEPGLRVAAVTVFVPETQPLGMLELTLGAMVDMQYPHDTWVLDESDDQDVRELCGRLGAKHFTRREAREHEADDDRVAAHSKHGRINAWLAEVGYDQYDVLAAIDLEHVPEPDYLERTVGYLRDSQVGYVQPAQVYYNQDASLIAGGAAEESYAFNSWIQAASHALGAPAVTGSHAVHRLAALRAVGGFPPLESEESHLTMLYRGAQWRGVYVPEILALGTTPVEWSGYLGQQRHRARALLEVKLRVYPKLAGRLLPMERLLGLLHGAYSLRSLTMLAIYPFVVLILLSNQRPTFLGIEALVGLSGMTLVLMLADRFLRRYVLDPERERGLRWRAMLLQFAKWPYLAWALWDALRGRRGGADETPKRVTRPWRGAVAASQLALAVGLCIAAAIGVARSGPLWPSVAMIAGVFFGLSLGLVWSELLWYPPPFEPIRHARRRAELAELFARRR
ncbi:MAG: glycosyltransferase [bacterium]